MSSGLMPSSEPPSVVIERVGRDDPMVERLLANEDDRYSDYHLEVFESALERHFQVEERLELRSGTRILYAASPRGRRRCLRPGPTARRR